ncbi:6-phospho-beta-glucosidase [Phycicoccus ginsengisoli]
MPLVHGALLGDATHQVDELRLHDTDPARLAAIVAVLEQQAAGVPDAPRVVVADSLDDALRGTDVVFSAMRVGGLRGRTVDERVALDLGLLGQETTGAGGVAYALRSVPVSLEVARRVAALAPDAWVVNFTNPAGVVTEAMQTVLGDRVIGICDSPVALARRAMRVLGLSPDATTVDYVGLNHLGWLRGLHSGGVDHLPRLLADEQLLARTEEGRLFGADWLRALGVVPNEYLYFYYFTREAVASLRGVDRTRGEFLRDQQEAFYAEVARHAGTALASWRRARAEREATYLQEARAEGEQRDELDLEGGGYEGVALALMAALRGGPRAELVLDVRSGGAVPGMPDDAVVEVPCTVDADGPRPHALAAPAGHMLGLMQSVKAVERLVVEAVTTRSEAAALEAFALHPLVDSVTSARAVLDAHLARSPEIAALLRP